MKNKPKVFIFIFLAIIIALTAFPTLTSKNRRKKFDGDASKSGLVDEYGFYDKEKQAEINSKIQSAAEDLETNIIIYLSGDNDRSKSERDIDDFTANECDRLFGKNVDAVYLYLDICGHSPAFDTFACHGKNGIIYPKKTRESILDKACSYLPPSGRTIEDYQLDEAIDEFLDQIRHESKKYKPNIFRWDYDSVTKLYFYSQNGKFYVTKTAPPIKRMVVLIIAIIAGIIAKLICYSTTKNAYKFKASTNPSVYVSHGESKLAVTSDTFLRTYTTKHKIESSSSSHGGGSIGRSSGGGGHVSSSRRR